MSRIGKLPVTVPAGVEVNIDSNNLVTVKGPKGELSQQISPLIEIKNEGAELRFTPVNDSRKASEQHGLARTLVHNMVVGVTDGFEKKLEMIGVGYKAEKKGDTLVMQLGYSHPVEMKDPEGITTELDGQNIIIVSGIDKEKVGQYAAEIREKRKPEPYKGKGIKYADEHIRRKVGKAGKKA